MSGGHFEYQQLQMQSIAEEIENLIQTNNDPTLNEYGERRGNYYPPEILEKFEETAHALRQTAEMTNAVDLLIKGDYGEESFKERWGQKIKPLLDTLDTTQILTKARSSKKYPAFFIVSPTDKPCEIHIAEMKEDGFLYYIHPRLRDKNEYWAMESDRATPLEDFGIRILIENQKINGELIDTPRATYSDGKPRRWQGNLKFSFEYNQVTKIKA